MSANNIDKMAKLVQTLPLLNPSLCTVQPLFVTTHTPDMSAYFLGVMPFRYRIQPQFFSLIALFQRIIIKDWGIDLYCLSEIFGPYLRIFFGNSENAVNTLKITLKMSQYLCVNSFTFLSSTQSVRHFIHYIEG